MIKRLMFVPLMLACVSATVSDTIVKTTEVQISNPYAGVLPPSVSVPSTTLSQSEPVDISKSLSDVGKIGIPSLTVNSNTLHSNTSDFSFVDELKITISPDSNNSSGLPELTVIDVQPTPDQKASSDLTVPVLPDSQTLLQYFTSGGLNMTFTFTISGQVPTAGLDVVDTLSLDVSVAVDKSVNDIGSIGK